MKHVTQRSSEASAPLDSQKNASDLRGLMRKQKFHISNMFYFLYFLWGLTRAIIFTSSQSATFFSIFLMAPAWSISATSY